MKHLILLLVLIVSTVGSNAQELVKIWETDTLLKTCESVLFDEEKMILYVSNIDGNPGAKDGKGSIGTVGLDGKIQNANWIAGLNAPKGMALYKGTLWVSDIDELLSIDVNSSMITSRIKIDGAIFLNDVAVDKKGIVYVSDSRTRMVHRVEGTAVSTYLDSTVLKGPNGLLTHGDDLYVLDQGTLYEVERKMKAEKVAEGMERDTDGIEPVGNNEFIVSCWGGTVYLVKEKKAPVKLLDTRAEKINSADIGYDRKNKTVYIPTFFKNSVAAYRLK